MALATVTCLVSLQGGDFPERKVCVRLSFFVIIGLVISVIYRLQYKFIDEVKLHDIKVILIVVVVMSAKEKNLAVTFHCLQCGT